MINLRLKPETFAALRAEAQSQGMGIGLYLSQLADAAVTNLKNGENPIAAKSKN